MEKVAASSTNYFSYDNISHLNRPFTEIEVCEAFFAMGPHKAPRFDGLHVFLFQRHWATIGESVFKVVLGTLNMGCR